MLMVTHASVTGAAGLAIGQPAVAFFAGIIIHFLMDKIPHVWPEEKKLQTLFKYGDVFLTTIFIVGLLFIPSDRLPALIAGAFGGIVVDLFLVGLMAEKGSWAQWHTKRQPHKANFNWLASDLAIFLTGVLLVWWLK